MFLMGQGSKKCDPNPPSVKSRCVHARYRRKNGTSGKGREKKKEKEKRKRRDIVHLFCSTFLGPNPRTST